jgi:hypothetical protein
MSMPPLPFYQAIEDLVLHFIEFSTVIRFPNKQFFSNLFVLKPLRQQLQDIEFAIGQRLVQGLGTGREGGLEGGIGNAASGP